jgi:uncharacterized protein (TIGR02391 family)
MKMDYYLTMDQVKRAILEKKALLASNYDPMIAAWLAYALIQDGVGQNPPLHEIIESLKRWRWTSDVYRGRDLGSYAMLGYLLKTQSCDLPIEIVHAMERITDIDPENRFSPLKDPVQLFMVSLFLGPSGSLSKIRTFLVDCIRGQMNGPPQRQILLSAALRELGIESYLPALAETPIEVGDVIALIWWCKRYEQERECGKIWNTLENLLDTIAYSDTLSDGAGDMRVLHVWEIAMFFEALKRELPHVNPITLFDMYPMHPRVKDIARKPFSNGEYLDAVLEATKALNDYTRNITDSKLGEIALVIEAFGNPNTKEIKVLPNVKFNPLDPTSRDYVSQLNEQRGLSFLAHGIIMAFRHPKGHEPKDTSWGNITPYEALDQLVTISYLMNRIEKAMSSNK